MLASSSGQRTSGKKKKAKPNSNKGYTAFYTQHFFLFNLWKRWLDVFRLDAELLKTQIDNFLLFFVLSTVRGLGTGM
jgi:hypothetical protein